MRWEYRTAFRHPKVHDCGVERAKLGVVFASAGEADSASMTSFSSPRTARSDPRGSFERATYIARFADGAVQELDEFGPRS